MEAVKYKFENDSLVRTTESKETKIKYYEFNDIIWIEPGKPKNGILKLDNYSFQVNWKRIEEYLEILEKITNSLESSYSCQSVGNYVDEEIFWIKKKDVTTPTPELRDFLVSKAKRILRTSLIIAIITAIIYTIVGVYMVSINEISVLGAIGSVPFTVYIICAPYLGIRRSWFWFLKIIKRPIIGCLFGIIIFPIILAVGLGYGLAGGGIYLVIKYLRIKRGEGFYEIRDYQLSEFTKRIRLIKRLDRDFFIKESDNP